MLSLARSMPQVYRIARRLTTRKPRQGDEAEECEYVSAEEYKELESKGALFISMVRNPKETPLSFSGYRLAEVQPRHEKEMVLLFGSIFSLKEIAARDDCITVHVVSDWKEGLERRGKDNEVYQARIRLNEEVAPLFSHDALSSSVDLVFSNDMTCPLQVLTTRLHSRLAWSQSRRVLRPVRSEMQTLDVRDGQPFLFEQYWQRREKKENGSLAIAPALPLSLGCKMHLE